MTYGPSRPTGPMQRSPKGNAEPIKSSKIPVAIHSKRPVKKNGKENKENVVPREMSTSLTPDRKKRKVSAVKNSTQRVVNNEKDDFLKSDLTKHSAINNNRLDKRDTKFDHTYIVFEDVDSNKHNARMLNTVSKEILIEKGFSQEQFDNLAFLEKSHSVDGVEMGCGFIFGEGGFGAVKFAEIYNDKNELIVVAAKKIKAHKCDGVEEIKKEVQLQNKAGKSTVKIYGMSETKDKSGNEEFVVFMEIAPGLEGKRFFDRVTEGRIVLSQSDKDKIAFNLLQAVETMHENGVLHMDLKWENVYIDPENNFNIKIIDFGSAESIEEGIDDKEKKKIEFLKMFDDIAVASMLESVVDDPYAMLES